MEVVPYILATAGHVDHGKSALVRALTGIDPDRLPEEKARGITIELGFAHLRLRSPPSVTPAVEYQIGIVDVPGHEDFVRNMVAGIGSIDMALLVIAADDGWMPQTEEHLQILMYLGVTRGVVALTKIDLLGAHLARGDAAPPSGRPLNEGAASGATEQAAVAALRAKLRDTPLAEAPVIPTSVLTGRGLDELKQALAAMFAQTLPQPDLGKPRLPVDRAFVLKGIGTVVTGTLTGGALRRGEAVVIQPSCRPAKVRTVQTHSCEVEVGRPGSRVALNLPDLAVDAGRATGTDAAVRRGDVVTLAALGAAAETIDVLLHRSPRDDARAAPLKDGVRVHVHHGSGDSAARVYLLGSRALAPGESTSAQLRFESPVFVFAGDRIVIRDWSARHTLAGGIVLDPHPPRQGFRGEGRRRFLERRAAAPGDVAVFVATQIERDGAVERSNLLAQSRFAARQIEAAVTQLAREGQLILVGTKAIDAARWRSLRGLAVERIEADHKAHPEQLGLNLADLRQAMADEPAAEAVFDALVAALCRDGFSRLGAVIRRAAHRPALPPKLQAAGARLRAALAVKPFEPPSRKEMTGDPLSMQAMKFLLDTGEAVAIGDDLVLSAEAVQRAGELVREYLIARGQATASDLKQALGTTRRVMMPLLEFLDAHGLTQRRGDLRVLRVK